MVMSGGYDPIIAAAAKKYGVSEDIIRSVMRVESGGRPGAVSSAGAGGLMQIMPATYTELAQKHGLGADRFDPTNNIMAGTAYLRENNDRFGGDWDKTFAAYNGGPNRVARGGPLPRETREYGPKVWAGIQGQPSDQAQLGRTAGQDQGADVAGFGQRRTTTGMGEEELMALSRNGQMPAPGSGGLLADETNNWMDGLGGLLGRGQTESQPPGPSIGQPNVGGRMNDLVAQLLQQSPQQQRPSMSPLQYQLAGAGQAVGQLAGVRDRKVGIGELLGALGGGLTRGQMAGDQAQQAQRADQFKELGALGDLDYRQRTAALNEQNSVYDNQYKQAQTLKALTPEAPETTPAVRNALAMGLQPGTQAFNDFIRQAGLPASTQVSVGAQERSEDKAYGEELVKDYANVRDTANAGRQSLQSIEIARKIPVTTGAIEPLRAKVGALAQSFGISPEALRSYGLDQATTAEAFTGVMQNLVLSKMQAQSGPQTQQDAQRIESTVASLGNTPEASDFLLRTGQAMASRDVEKHNFYEQYRASKGSLNGVQQAWDQELSGRPLLGVNPNSRLPVFYDEFVPAFLQANPGATKADALTMWKSKYGQ